MPRLRLDPFSPNGISVVTEITKLEQRGTQGWLQTASQPSGVQSIVAGTNVTVDATDPANPIVSSSGGGGGGTGITRTVSVISTDTNAGTTSAVDYVYFITGDTVLTLPTAIGNTNRYTAKNVGVGSVTVATALSQTIDGAASLALSATNPPYKSVDLLSDGANWYII